MHPMNMVIGAMFIGVRASDPGSLAKFDYRKDNRTTVALRRKAVNTGYLWLMTRVVIGDRTPKG